jgi:hypothetical protein
MRRQGLLLVLAAGCTLGPDYKLKLYNALGGGWQAVEGTES